MKGLVLVMSEHILQPNVVHGANFSLTIMKLTAGLFLETLVLIADSQFQICSLRYTGFPYLAAETPPLLNPRDDLIFTPGEVIALPQGNNVP